MTLYVESYVESVPQMFGSKIQNPKDLFVARTMMRSSSPAVGEYPILGFFTCNLAFVGLVTCDDTALLGLAGSHALVN